MHFYDWKLAAETAFDNLETKLSNFDGSVNRLQMFQKWSLSLKKAGDVITTFFKPKILSYLLFYLFSPQELQADGWLINAPSLKCNDGREMSSKSVSWNFSLVGEKRHLEEKNIHWRLGQWFEYFKVLNTYSRCSSQRPRFESPLSQKYQMKIFTFIYFIRATCVRFHLVIKRKIN